MRRTIDEALRRWKQSKDRMPLLLDGARQVGKTYALVKFAKENYDDCVHVNLDISSRIRESLDLNISPESILKVVEAETQQKIVPGKSLLILDEIQSSERALSALKYFCEDAPQYHVAAAGSLLGAAINRERYSFPVGKVNSLHMYPMDFEEYLWARNEKVLADEIRDGFERMMPLLPSLHLKAIELYRDYLICGGMPRCVQALATGQSLREISWLQREILDNYLADMARYASNSETVKIRSCFESIPAQLAKENHKFQYRVVRKGGSAAVFGASIEWLRLAGVVLKCQNVEHGYLPLSAYADLSAFKLYMADVGLLTMRTQLPHSIILSGHENTFMGALTENYVAQQLAAHGHELYYWTSDGRAELDFVTPTEEGIAAIEVKKGEHTKGKSLRIFMGKYKPNVVIRLALKEFGSYDGIRTVPLYATHCL
ncbi:MAG: DUF4143 domain-containing protein [Coriobacteriales bacterium]|nr:DUF4143 domain-containing protein [Coriobacteriales bacterium]